MDSSKISHPPFQEGDARVVEAYAKVLEKVIEKGDASERMQWFDDIESLLKLLPRGNVTSSLKGALQNAIAACACVSSAMKQKVCCLLEQYGLPVLPIRHGLGQHSAKQEYDSTYELTEVEARQREYLCTLSYLQLSNCLSGHGLDMESGRYFEIFQFVREQVFGMYSQRLYVNPVERWELVVAALHHFEIILSKYEVSDEDMRSRTDNLFASGNSSLAMSSSWSAAKYKSATPALELMKDLKNGGVIYSNLMSIFMLGVKSVLEQRASQLCGQFLEEAVSLSFQIFIHSVLKESIFAEACHTSLQALPNIIFQDVHKVVTLLEYVRYDKSPVIQRHSVKVMELFSERVPELVSMLRVADAVSSIIEGYAACLEARFLDPYPTRNPDEDTGSLILRLFLVNLSKPPPNLTHLLLGFDVNQVVEKSKLEPNEYFSCLTVILRALDTLARPEVNAGVHEIGFKLLYDLCVDPITCGPMVDLLRDGKYDFLPKYKTSPSSQDTCPEKGLHSFISGTDPSSPEALFDLERQSRDNCDSPAESAPDASKPAKPEVGFLNPEPLASRTENDGLGESSALKSSWIQRLFPGLLDENVKAGSQWKSKGKQVAADSDESERLLLENNATKSREGPGSSSAVQHLGLLQGRLGSMGEDGSRKDSGSQPPSASTSRQGLSPAEDLNLNQDCPMDQDTYAHESGNSLTLDQETGRSSKVSFIHALKYIASDVDTRSSQGEYHPVQRQSPTVSRRFYQQAELNLDGVGSRKEQTQSPRFGKFEFQQGVTRITSYMDDTPTGKGVEGTMRMDDVNVDEVNEDTTERQDDVGPSSRPLPPLSLFAPFKHSKERRGSALSEGPKTFEETPSTTPLFSSRGYRAGAPETGNFDSSVFALYKPLSLSPPIAGSPDFHGNLMSLTPIFAPFKMVDEPNGPSTSFIKTERLHAVDIEEQECGKNILEHDHNWIDAKAKQVERQGQSAMHGPRSSSIYSRTPLPVVSDERKAHSMFSPNSQVPRFNEPRLRRLGITGNAHEAGISKGRRSHTVNTAAIELNSRRPSLDEDSGRSATLKKEPLRPPSDVQLSASQGMRDLFQFDQDLQRQRMNAEAEAVRPFSNLVSEPSSGSSPVSGGARSGQQDEIKVTSPSNSEVKGKKTLEGPSVVMEDAEWDQINAVPYVPDRGTASTFNVAAQSSEAGLLSRRMPVPDREERLSFLTGSRNFEEKPLTSAQEGTIPGRSSRKRTHDARTTDSQYSAAQNSEPAFAVPQNRDVEGESRATPRPQSWLQRWMPKPAGATGFKTPQFAGSTVSKNRRLSLDSDSVGGEEGPSPSRAGSHRDDQFHQNANPLFAGEYPVPSAAAMAIVGAANRMSVPLPPQRVGTRIAVWPATAGMLMRRAAESESPEVLTAQVDVEVIVEARHEWST